MSVSAHSVTTARLRYGAPFARNKPKASRRLLITALTLFLLVAGGFALRVADLSAEGLSEDELNKLRAVEDYRAHGLTGANGEHPMLMKALLTVSVITAERWNETAFAADASYRIEPEAALRFPGALLGTFITLLIYFLAAELFGVPTALVAAALWAFDPSAIGFNRIAKEDTFLLFFFLLANVFWVRSQTVAEEGRRNPEPLYWATAASFGAMVASKYVPHLISISVCYNYIFQGLPWVRWRIGKKRFLIFFCIVGLFFLLCNPTILLPDTWHEMRAFATEKRISHGAYEFINRLYPNQMSLWLRGVPWYFYFVFMAFKLPPLTLLGLFAGTPLIFTRRTGDGRFFLYMWLLFWFLPFSALGGKFTRYFTFALPFVFIIAAIGLVRLAQIAGERLMKFFKSRRDFAFTQNVSRFLHPLLFSLLVISTLYATFGFTPYYRLYTNIFGGGWAQAGKYFPHDEFYDGGIREAALDVAAQAPQNPNGARVFNETPELMAYYLQRAGRNDIASTSLSDKTMLAEIKQGDFIVAARGRRYFSNDAIITVLHERATPLARVLAGRTTAINIYRVDEPLMRLLYEVSHPL